MENNQTTRTMAMEDLHLIRQVLDQAGHLVSDPSACLLADGAGVATLWGSGVF